LSPDGTELDEAIAMANKIVDLAPLALATMKRFVTGYILPKGPSELAARFAADLAAVRNSEDAAEGVQAFKERRRPRYQGRSDRQHAATQPCTVRHENVRSCRRVLPGRGLRPRARHL
jgi:hypothetical protein